MVLHVRIFHVRYGEFLVQFLLNFIKLLQIKEMILTLAWPRPAYAFKFKLNKIRFTRNACLRMHRLQWTLLKKHLNQYWKVVMYIHSAEQKSFKCVCAGEGFAAPLCVLLLQ